MKYEQAYLFGQPQSERHDKSSFHLSNVNQRIYGGSGVLFEQKKIITMSKKLHRFDKFCM